MTCGEPCRGQTPAWLFPLTPPQHVLPVIQEDGLRGSRVGVGEQALGLPGIHSLYLVCWFCSVQTILEAAHPLPHSLLLSLPLSFFFLSPLLSPSSCRQMDR